MTSRKKKLVGVGILVVGLLGGVAIGHWVWPKTELQPVDVRLRIQGIDRPTAAEKVLAERFSPLLVLGHFADDPWYPQQVATYLCHATLVTPTAAIADANRSAATSIARPVTPCQAAQATPGARAPGCGQSWPLPYQGGLSCVLDLNECTLQEDAPCYTHVYPRSSMAKSGQTERNYYYVRMHRIPEKVDDQLAGRMRSLRWVFQYWFFYPFDDWRDVGLHLRQVHEGDWEFAMVGVSAVGPTPLFVAYSHHCFGGWSWFNDPRLTLSREKSTDGAHPVLYVADGSHALYAQPGSPNVKLAHCALGVSLHSVLGSAGGLHDRTVPPSQAAVALATAERRATNPASATHLLWIGARSNWLNFDQPWGEGEDIYTPILGWTEDANGPAGPAFQGHTWTSPVYTILCSDAWTDDSAAGRTNNSPLAAAPCSAKGQSAAPTVSEAARPG